MGKLRGLENVDQGFFPITKHSRTYGYIDARAREDVTEYD